MLTKATEYFRTAKVVTQKVAELLSAQVCVTNEQGIVIASSNLELVGLSSNDLDNTATNHYLRVPLSVDMQAGEVIVGEPCNGDVISPRLAQVLIEMVINQTAIIDNLPTQHQLKDKFIYDLLHGLIDETTVVRYSKLLGLDLSPPRAVILIDASEYILGNHPQQSEETVEVKIRRRAQLVISSIVRFFLLPKDTICAYIGDGEIAVLKASNTKNLANWAKSGDVLEQSSYSWANLTALNRAAIALLACLRADTGTEISIGIGRYHPGIQGLAHSYQDARAALSLGCRFHGKNQVHCLAQLGIAALVGVSDEKTKIELATHLLSPLDREPELLATLDTFFATNLSSKATASQLLIHRNTLTYRLEKITSLIGLDPRRFDDAVQIRLALLLRSLNSTFAAKR
ncbi:PucR family transcriptional regulator [Gloeocapsopsis crepidinum]|uniref:PucR family transcriptional regulator n=1 Tax=Gloeocapsopsis crepidinum TaxID=693223 RepID=UPI001D1512DD|nr:helix-turn-helix domain-containing protein [Gloeocapsopsis crepidinum]